MQKLLNIGELADFLGFTVAAVSAHLHRKNWDAVPKPIKLGRRLAWPVERCSPGSGTRSRPAMSKGRFRHLVLGVPGGCDGRCC